MIKTNWYKDAFFYQIYPRSFKDGNGDGIGDIRGIIEKLDYLKELGIDAVWLSPCYKSPNDDNGYDISDYRDIMTEFGTLADWREMIDGMHERGIRLVMDLVVNHTSDEHAWFVESKKGKDNPYRDYYFWRKGKGRDGKRPPNNWVSRFGGSAWEYDEVSGEFYLHLFTKKQPDLNWDNPTVRREIADMVKYWLDLGVDGFRCDVITYISKAEGLPNGKKLTGGDEMFTHGPNIHSYLGELNREVLSKYDCMTVGEAAGVTVEQALLYTGEGRNELDTVFQFEHVEANTFFRVIPRKFNLKRTKPVFTKWQKGLYNKGWTSLYLENHDQPRCISTYILDNKDNDDYLRKQGAKMLATAVYFQQGTPYVYQGQELGMTNLKFESEADHVDVMSKTILGLVKRYAPFLKGYAMKALQVRSRDNSRTPMQWSDKPNAGFCDDGVAPWYKVNPNYNTINAGQAVSDPNSIFSFFKKLISIRKGNDIIIKGVYEEYCANSPDIYVYTREYEGKKLLVICNFKNKQVQYKANKAAFCGGVPILSNYDFELKYGDLMLRPYECIVFCGK